MTDYVPRVVDAEVDTALATLGAVLIEGPRAFAEKRKPQWKGK